MKSKSKQIVRKIEQALNNTEGFVMVLRLSHEDLKRIIQIEQEGEHNALNEGLREVIKRQTIVAVVKTPNFSQSVAPTVLLVSNGEIVGEEIVDSRRGESLKCDPKVVFVGEKFVIYRDRVKNLPVGGSLFVFPPLPFPQLEHIQEIEDVVAASPSPLADVYVKKKCGLDIADTRLGTLLVGFNVK